MDSSPLHPRGSYAYAPQNFNFWPNKWYVRFRPQLIVHVAICNYYRQIAVRNMAVAAVSVILYSSPAPCRSAAITRRVNITLGVQSETVKIDIATGYADGEKSC